MRRTAQIGIDPFISISFLSIIGEKGSSPLRNAGLNLQSIPSNTLAALLNTRKDFCWMNG